MRKLTLFIFAVFLVISCSKEDKSGTFVSVKESQFAIDNKYFLPIGENVGWLKNISDYEYYFNKLSDNGANTVRVIMVPWDTDIEWQSIGKYDQSRIEKLDKILELAKKYGLKVILSLDIYGELRAKSNDSREMLWDKNPYNVKNGGPCFTPDEFFTNNHAKEAYKKRLSFIIYRYKNNPTIFAYEFWNEVDITDNYDEENVYLWHKEISEYLISIDNNHLITTSFANPVYDDKIWEIMDFSQLHYHEKNMVMEMQKLIKDREKIGKPIIFSEFSLGTNPQINLDDLNGAALHDGLWISSMHGVGAFPWWWDEYIEENNLYYHFDALARYWKNETLNTDYDSFSPNVSCDCDTYGLINSTKAFIYIKSKDKGSHINSRMEISGDFYADLYNTTDGTVISNVNFSDTLIIPYLSTDIAIKLRRIIKI